MTLEVHQLAIVLSFVPVLQLVGMVYQPDTINLPR
jgi:hypothetical protein